MLPNPSRYVLLVRVVFGLVLALTLLVWLGVGTSFFGYRAVATRGTSMEPTLYAGDALWVKYLNPAEVRIGNIVTLQRPGEESITHRVIAVEILPRGSFLFETRGDANKSSERWDVNADEKIAVTFIRFSFAGYVLNFFAGALGRYFLSIGVIVIGLAALHMTRRKQNAHIRAG